MNVYNPMSEKNNSLPCVCLSPLAGDSDTPPSYKQKRTTPPIYRLLPGVYITVAQLYLIDRFYGEHHNERDL